MGEPRAGLQGVRGDILHGRPLVSGDVVSGRCNFIYVGLISLKEWEFLAPTLTKKRKERKRGRWKERKREKIEKEETEKVCSGMAQEFHTGLGSLVSGGRPCDSFAQLSATNPSFTCLSSNTTP